MSVDENADVKDASCTWCTPYSFTNGGKREGERKIAMWKSVYVCVMLFNSCNADPS